MLRDKIGNNGFTLLELLISIVIVAIIVTTMFSALRMGLNVWDKGKKDSELICRLQIIRKLMKTQVASVCTEALFEKKSGEDNSVFMLRGEETQLEFISRYSILPEHSCRVVYVKYYLGTGEHENDLMILEKDFCLAGDYETFLESGSDFANGGGVVLVGNVEDLEFEYLSFSEKGELLTHPSWGTEDASEKEFPEAVGIHLLVSDMESNMTVQLMSK